jgi:hypothetical protein
MGSGLGSGIRPGLTHIEVADGCRWLSMGPRMSVEGWRRWWKGWESDDEIGRMMSKRLRHPGLEG